MTIRITHPAIVWWRSLYGLVFMIGIIWILLQMIFQPKTPEETAWMTIIEILVFVILILFWWSRIRPSGKI